MKTTWRILVPMVLTSAIAIGCGGGVPDGPSVYTVEGTVSYSGQPLKDADLLVRTVDGKHAAGAKVTDGKFVLKAPVGQSKVEITAMREIPGEFREENPGERVAVKEQFIPARYNSESTLQLDVKANQQDVAFNLEP